MDDKAQLRVRVALDALAQIDAGLRRVERGTYVKGPSGKTLQDVAKGECEVCALGTLLLAHLSRAEQKVYWRDLDGQKWNDSGVMALRSRAVYSRLAEAFDERQLLLIEAAFECWTYERTRVEWASHPSRVLGIADCEATWRFGMEFGGDEDRLRAILHNIVRNGGTFDPTDLREGLPEAIPPVPELGACAVRQDEPTSAEPPRAEGAVR